MTNAAADDFDYLAMFDQTGAVCIERVAEIAAVEADMAAAKATSAARVARRLSHPCPRCSGNGFISAFQHIKAGECFACGGTGTR